MELNTLGGIIVRRERGRCCLCQEAKEDRERRQHSGEQRESNGGGNISGDTMTREGQKRENCGGQGWKRHPGKSWVTEEGYNVDVRPLGVVVNVVEDSRSQVDWGKSRQWVP